MPVHSSRETRLSIIIPTLNERRSIGRTLSQVSRVAAPAEIIVVDGGSEDDTREIAMRHGAQVISAPRGRGAQMHCGARAARGDVFWFVHADTLVPLDAAELISSALFDEQVVGGNFNVRFDGPEAAARFMTWFYPQLRRLGLCYGDSAFFVRREAYERSGGFNPLPIFEDLDLLRRLKKLGRFVHLSSNVVTSGRRFQKGRFAGVFARWLSLQLLYWLGFEPGRLQRLYVPVREGGDEVITRADR